MLIPEFLEPYRAEIEKWKMDTVAISTTSVGENETLSLTQSKFRGKPYFPIGIEYPKGADGKPMVLLAQINFDEVPPLENYPATGILQVFVHPDFYDNDEYKILYHETTTEAYCADFSFLTEHLYTNCPVDQEYKLSFKKQHDYGHVTDFRFDIKFGAPYDPPPDAEDKIQHYHDNSETFSLKQIEELSKYFYSSYDNFKKSLPEDHGEELEKFFEAKNHKLGGYAHFTQDDPRGYDDDLKNDLLVLQINSEIHDDKHIMFGDVGVAHLFINSEDLKNKRFDLAYFHWDCS